jgi:hypothetical protein
MSNNPHLQPQLNPHQCIEELSWNVEELAFVRLLGERFELAAMYPEPPQQIIRSILKPLHSAIRATSLAFAATIAVESGKPFVCRPPWPECHWSGPQQLTDEQCQRLAIGQGQRVVDNELRTSGAAAPAGIDSAIVIGVGNFHCWVGHFLALNSQHPDGFGTREASLLRTVAALLTMYAMNYRETPAAFEIEIG